MEIWNANDPGKKSGALRSIARGQHGSGHVVHGANAGGATAADSDGHDTSEGDASRIRHKRAGEVESSIERRRFAGKC